MQSYLAQEAITLDASIRWLEALVAQDEEPTLAAKMAAVRHYRGCVIRLIEQGEDLVAELLAGHEEERWAAEPDIQAERAA